MPYRREQFCLLIRQNSRNRWLIGQAGSKPIKRCHRDRQKKAPAPLQRGGKKYLTAAGGGQCVRHRIINVRYAPGFPRHDEIISRRKNPTDYRPSRSMRSRGPSANSQSRIGPTTSARKIVRCELPVETIRRQRFEVGFTVVPIIDIMRVFPHIDHEQRMP